MPGVVAPWPVAREVGKLLVRAFVTLGRLLLVRAFVTLGKLLLSGESVKSGGSLMPVLIRVGRTACEDVSLYWRGCDSTSTYRRSKREKEGEGNET